MPKTRSQRKKHQSGAQVHNLDKYLSVIDVPGSIAGVNKMAAEQISEAVDEEIQASLSIESSIETRIEEWIDAVQETLLKALNELKESLKIQITGHSNQIANLDTKCEKIVPALEKSIEFSQGISSDNTKRIMHLEKENLDLKNSIQILEKQCMDQKNSMLNLEKNLNVKILNLERYSREFNIRFVGIPEKDNENCHNIIAKKIREENL